MLHRVASMGFFKDRYGGDKNCVEYKNKNWVEIWDMINIRGFTFSEEKCAEYKNSKN